MTAAGPAFSLDPGAQKTVAFALIAGDNFDDITEQAFNAETFYQDQGIPLVLNAMPSFGINMHPNPATDQLFIKNETMGETFYQIVSVNGTVMETGRYTSQKNIDLTRYSNGIYAVQFIGEHGGATKLFVVNHP